MRPPGDRPGLLPAFLDPAQRRPGGPDVGDRDELARLFQQLRLDRRVLAQRRVLGREHFRPGGEERVLRGLEPGPQGVLIRAGGPAGRLPLPHQLAEGGSGGRPVGGRRQALGLDHELLLAGAGGPALLLEVGEVGLAALVEGVACGREPLPQGGFDRPVGARRRLPLLQQLPQPLTTVLPVGRRRGDVLGLGDDALLDVPGLGAGMVAGGPDLLLAVVDLPGQRLEPGLELAQVAHRMRVRHRRAQPLDPSPCLGGRQVRGGNPLLQQGHLGVQRLELATVERESLVRAPSLPGANHPLTLSGTHVDRAVVVNPAPRIVGGAHREPPAQP